MPNYLLNPHMVAREIVRLIGQLTKRSEFKLQPYSNGDYAQYCGVLCNLRIYMNDDNFWFDIWADNINFTISFPIFSNIWKLSMDDFSEKLIVPLLYKKLEYYGYATWD